MWITLGVAAAILVVGVYLSWTAGRIDRLHTRVEAAAASLDAQLVRRAASALAFAGELPADRPAAERLREAALAARAVDGLDHRREIAENALSRVLHVVADEAPGDLVAASLKVRLARQFYNDAVRDTLSLRRRRIPRLFRLAGRAALPSYFEIDDSPLAGTRD